ncbi:MAG: hypothetical protein ACLFVO_09115 [Chloroflexaceae bacterium]
MALAVVALVTLVELLQCFFTDVMIHFQEAIAVAIVAVVTHYPQPPDHYKQILLVGTRFCASAVRPAPVQSVLS